MFPNIRYSIFIASLNDIRWIEINCTPEKTFSPNLHFIFPLSNQKSRPA